MITPIDIRIGTLVSGNDADPASYIEQIIPHGFESFSITFQRTVGDIDLKALAARVQDAIGGRDVLISSLGVFGNALDGEEQDLETLRSFEVLIDNAHHFGTNIVAGFTGRLRGKSVPESLGRFKEVFGPLAKRAEDNGVKIAFENCPMGGNWGSGDWNIAHNPTAWQLIFDAVPSSALGLEWEPCHQMSQLIDPLPQLREWTGKIFHVHGKDANVLWDVVKKNGIGGCQRFAIDRTPGFGDTNWTDVISELRRNGYAGSIDIEGWHDPVYNGALEMTGQVHGLNYLKACRTTYVQNPA